mmetsp:Transcript_20379/g.21162  ORF Transcript_20379/g.21162 Transcript_20379/m.21162 type:complete len:548 (+) Transcript_20379:8-1651(+)
MAVINSNSLCCEKQFYRSTVESHLYLERKRARSKFSITIYICYMSFLYLASSELRNVNCKNLNKDNNFKTLSKDNLFKQQEENNKIQVTNKESIIKSNKTIQKNENSTKNWILPNELDQNTLKESDDILFSNDKHNESSSLVNSYTKNKNSAFNNTEKLSHRNINSSFNNSKNSKVVKNQEMESFGKVFRTTNSQSDILKDSFFKNITFISPHIQSDIKSELTEDQEYKGNYDSSFQKDSKIKEETTHMPFKLDKNSTEKILFSVFPNKDSRLYNITHKLDAPHKQIGTNRKSKHNEIHNTHRTGSLSLPSNSKIFNESKLQSNYSKLKDEVNNSEELKIKIFPETEIKTNEEVPYVLHSVISKKPIKIQTINKRLRSKYDKNSVIKEVNSTVKSSSSLIEGIDFASLSEEDKSLFIKKYEYKKDIAQVSLSTMKEKLNRKLRNLAFVKMLEHQLKLLSYKTHFYIKAYEKESLTEKETILVKYELEKYFENLFSGQIISARNKSVFQYLPKISGEDFVELSHKLMTSVGVSSPLYLEDQLSNKTDP